MNSEEQAFDRIDSSEDIDESILAWLRIDPTLASTPSYPFPDPEEKLREGEAGTGKGEEAARLGEAFEKVDLVSKPDIKSDPKQQENDSEKLFPEILDGEYRWEEKFPDVANTKSQQDIQFRPGDIPVVQERFNALLKRRLKSEIQERPPLFPWEGDRVFEYQAENNDFSQVQQVPALDLWLPQLQQIGLPVAVPEMVLANLLEQCNSVIKSSLRQGQKLVRAVEALFPGRERELHQLAGLAIASPTRSAIASPTRGASSEAISRLCTDAGDFPSSYESATQTQQMVLSLLAVRETLGTLTLRVSKNKPHLERQWLTSAGPLNIEIEYEPGNSKAPLVRVRAQMPCGGSLQLAEEKTQASCDRLSPGMLSVELSCPQKDQNYFLEIRLQNQEQNPLIFAISCSDRET
ncbi:MAG: hypothetical protein F6J93_27495 [Oscillatoria sp. SIO1A7]|nr:hypothetical protein [Oscillatoria sp. SIO1A7]